MDCRRPGWDGGFCSDQARGDGGFVLSGHGGGGASRTCSEMAVWCEGRNGGQGGPPGFCLSSGKDEVVSSEDGEAVCGAVLAGDQEFILEHLVLSLYIDSEYPTCFQMVLMAYTEIHP